MSRFYGDMRGIASRGPGKSVTRTGTQGITAHVRGWNIGIEATVYIDDDGYDCVSVKITGGSKKPNNVHVVQIEDDNNNKRVEELSKKSIVFHFTVPDLREDM